MKQEIVEEAKNIKDYLGYYKLAIQRTYLPNTPIIEGCETTIISLVNNLVAEVSKLKKENEKKVAREIFERVLDCQYLTKGNRDSYIDVKEVISLKQKYLGEN